MPGRRKRGRAGHRSPLARLGRSTGEPAPSAKRRVSGLDIAFSLHRPSRLRFSRQPGRTSCETAVGVLACWAVFSIAVPGAQQAPQTPPTFRTGVDVVQLDVSVLDENRGAVRGLTAADFTILENGRPRPIVAFSSVDLPPAESVAQSDPSVVPSDVTTNLLPEGWLLVIHFDHTIQPGAEAVLARTIGAAAVDALGPGDLGAVVFSVRGKSQNLTSDKGRLHSAVESFNMGLPDDGSPRGECMCDVCTLEAITRVAEAVREERHRRKALLGWPTRKSRDSRSCCRPSWRKSTWCTCQG